MGNSCDTEVEDFPNGELLAVRSEKYMFEASSI